MKKATILILFFFLIGNSSLVMAETIHHDDKMKIKPPTPEMIIKAVTPAVTEAVKKEHGDKATWTPDRITKLSINNDHTVQPKKTWYEIKLKIHVQSPDKNEKYADMVILKIDFQKPNLEDAKVTPLEYIHDVKE
ncbi:DUF3888 domain-containing protein [Heyndrickxia sp. NPDC080065]|uniref:DUF3888 domain-containing protein n=1 Tax=Heyndrickxia sp. NPDC080065 TaxID=3390568 RepID=UPI003D0331EA